MGLNRKSDLLITKISEFRVEHPIEFELVMNGTTNPINCLHVFVAHMLLWNHQCGIATLTLS